MLNYPAARHRISKALLLAAGLALSASAAAAEVTWTNTATAGGTGVIYNVAGNWSDGLAPSAGNTYLVNGTNITVRTPDADTMSFAGGLLSFTGGSRFELYRTNGGGTRTVQVNGNGLLFDNATLSLRSSNGGINFNINQAVTIGAGGLNIIRGGGNYGINGYFKGAVSGSGNISWKVDATGGNSSNILDFRSGDFSAYNGNIIVTGPASTKWASLQVGASGWGSGDLTLNRRSTLALAANQTTTAAETATVTVQGSSSTSINLASGSKLIVSSIVFRDGGYIQAITNNTGELQIRDGGTLSLNAGTATSTFNGAIRLLGDATWNIGDVTSSTGTDLTLGNAGDGIKLFNLYGSGTLAKTGAGTVALSGSTASFTGTLDWQGGVLNVITNGVLGDHALAFASGTLLQASGTTDVTVAGSLTGAGGLNKSNTGTLTLNAANLTGNHTINGGRVVLAGTSTIGGASTNVAAGAVLETVPGLSLVAGQTLTARGADANDAASGDLVGDFTLSGGTSTSSPGAALVVGGSGTFGTVLLQGNLSLSGHALARFDLGPDLTVGAGASDLLRVSGDVSLADNARFTLSGGSLASGSYRLLTYGGTLVGFENLTVAFSSATRSTFTKVHDEGAKAIDVTVGAAAANLRWLGTASQSWDITTTANFDNLGTAEADVFFAGDNVDFDGQGAGTVTLASGLTAGGVSFSGPSDYTLAGGLTLAASTFAKSDDATLTVATPVNVSSSATLSGGILEITAGGSLNAPLSVGPGTVLSVLGGTLAGTTTVDGGTASLTGGTVSAALAVNSGDLTLAGATVSGASAVNAGTLTLDSGTVSGRITVDGGTASLTGGTASGGLTVDSGTATVNGTALSGTVDVNAGTLSYLAAGTFASAHTIATGAEAVFNLASGTQTVTGTLGGSGLLTKRGNGTLILNPTADSSFGGSIVVDAGTLQISAGDSNTPNTFTSAGASTASITVKSGATLDLPRLHASSVTVTWADLPSVALEGGSTLRFRASTGNDFHNTDFNLSVDGEVTVNNNGGAYDNDITHAGAVTGSGRINYLATSSSGGGTYQRTLTLNQADSAYSGDWFVDYTASTSDDHIELRANAAGALGSGNVILDDRARLINNAANGLDSLAGVTLEKSTSELRLTSQAWSNDAADLTVNAGTVTLGAAANAVGNLSGVGGAIQAGNVASALAVNQTSDATFGGALTATANSALAFTKAGAATLTLTGASTAAGTVAVNEGKLVLSGGENRLSTAADITVAAGATLEVASTNAILRQDAANQGAITLAGGTLLLSGASTGGAHLGNLALSNGGTVAAAEGAGTYFGWNFNINGDVAVTGSSGSSISAAIGLLGARTFNVSDATGSADVDLDITGAVRDSDTVAGALVKAGAGTLRLGAANAFTGGLTVDAGTVLIADLAALGTGAVTLNTGGILDLGGLNPLNTVILAGGTLANAASWTGTAALAGGSYDASSLNDLSGGVVEIREGALADLSGVEKDVLFAGGAVSGLESYEGTLSVAGGTLDLTALFAPPTATLEVRDGGAIDFGFSEFDGSVVYRGGAVTGNLVAYDAHVTGANVALAAGAISETGEFVVGAGQSAVLGAGLANTVRLAGGAITSGLLGPGGFAGLLVIEGDGVLTLANPNSDPALSGPAQITLRDGGRLDGVGDLGTALVASGGVLAPGNSPGTLVFTGNLQLETLGILQFEIASVLPGEGSLDGQPIPGEQYDAVTVAGELNLANLSPTDRFLLELISLDGFNTPGFAADGWSDSSPYLFTLVTYGTLDLGANTAGVDGDISNLFTIDADGFIGESGQALTAAAFRVAVDEENSRLVLSYVAPIPEPSTYGLALGALALAAAALRRRKKTD